MKIDPRTTENGSSAALEMSDAASRFLESLSPDQRDRATFHYADGERLLWYYPPLNRHGLALRDMDQPQRELAQALMATGLTERSNEQANLIIEHEEVLGPLELEQNIVTYLRDPDLYYWTVFGDPKGDTPWAWRVEGHHISIHFSVWNQEIISSTPFFFGANPAEVHKGPKKGLRILGDREDLAFELMESLDRSQQSKAVIYDTAPLDIITYNATRVSLPAEEGLPASQMSGTQREMLMALATEYVNQLPPDMAQGKLDFLRQGGLDRIHLAWGGPIQKGVAHYYRLHGMPFVVEFDNRQDGANHIHSVLRDYKNDFALDVLSEHLLLYHIL